MAVTKNDVIIGIGSNIEPKQSIRKALSALSDLIIDSQLSRFYRSTAMGFDGPDFINVGLKGKTDLSPTLLLQALKAIEHDLALSQNQTASQNRIIDLDLYIYADLKSHRLPRKDLLIYPFAAQIMVDLCPHQNHPIQDRSYEQIADDLNASSILKPIVFDD